MSAVPDQIADAASAVGRSIKDVLGDVAEAISNAKSEIARIGGEIDELQGKRAGIVNAPPHTDDIVAYFLQGLKSAGHSFETRIAAHLNDRNWSSEKAAATIQSTAGGQLLTVAAAPNPEKLQPIWFAPGARGAPETASLDIGAVTYFLRDQIAAEIPALVERLVPSSRSGTKQADRVAALREIDARLDVLSAEQEERHAAIQSLRSAAR